MKTGDVDSQSGSHAKSTLTGTAVGAATGAAIGAAAGGGAGAAVGAGAGAAAGTVAGMAMGKSVEIAPETRFTYKLTEAVRVNYKEARNDKTLRSASRGSALIRAGGYALAFRWNMRDGPFDFD